MNKSAFYPIHLIVACCLLGICGASCHKKHKDLKPDPNAKDKKQPAREAVLIKAEGANTDVARRIETLTGGAHARIVWSQSQDPRDPDTFSSGQQALLKGVATRDGLGERDILQERGNYTRPLLSTDGQNILYTSRRQHHNEKKWSQDAEIFRTDWKGTAPVRMAIGWAVSCWRDPVTGIEWVYAVRDWSHSGKRSPDPSCLFRFPLDHPEKTEIIYDETTLDADNIQLSRDGLRASGGFPWPNAGVFMIDEKTVTAHKLLNGCWPALSPDSSHVSWVFDGTHRKATFFANDGEKSWTVGFNPPDTKGREMYHPRWSNHPRYFVITGPYKSGKRGGTSISRGGRSAEIYLGRFDASLVGVEAWVKITENSVGDNYPDAWIEGGDKAQLSGFGTGAVKSTKTVETSIWPGDTSGTVFLWRDHDAYNTWRTPDGRNHEARIEYRGAARSGRYLEMSLDGGDIVLEETAAQEILDKLQAQPSDTFEALVLPPSSESNVSSDVPSFIYRSPGFSLCQQNGHLVLSDHTSGHCWKSSAAAPLKPFHIVVVHRTDGFALYINGSSAALVTQDTAPGAISESIIFGGNWSGSLLNVAIYLRALDEGEVKKNSQVVLKNAVRFKPASAPIKVRAKLLDSTAPPSPESITPYTSSLVACVYEVEQVVSGTLPEKRVLVKHWGLLNRLSVIGFPREEGKSYDLLLEKEDSHPELKGERVTDETNVFDLEPWFDITPPRVNTAR